MSTKYPRPRNADPSTRYYETMATFCPALALARAPCKPVNHKRRRPKSLLFCNFSPGDAEALKICWSFAKPDYCGILHSVPAGNAVAAGMVESISNQACGSVSCAELLTLAM
jgi:hypothetical protein